MAMLRKLWSLNALGIELNMDRRTIARIMDGVRPDGKLQGHAAWYLTTALTACADDEQPEVQRRDGESILSHFAGRLSDWREIHTGDRTTVFSIEEIARMTGEEPETLLTWLRAGMPYAVQGDWETGDGFGLTFAWVFDWKATLSCLARFSGDRTNAAKLGLHTR
jgi:hypothetical protein